MSRLPPTDIAHAPVMRTDLATLPPRNPLWRNCGRLAVRSVRFSPARPTSPRSAPDPDVEVERRGVWLLGESRFVDDGLSLLIRRSRSNVTDFIIRKHLGLPRLFRWGAINSPSRRDQRHLGRDARARQDAFWGQPWQGATTLLSMLDPRNRPYPDPTRNRKHQNRVARDQDQPLPPTTIPRRRIVRGFFEQGPPRRAQFAAPPRLLGCTMQVQEVRARREDRFASDGCVRVYVDACRGRSAVIISTWEDWDGLFSVGDQGDRAEKYICHNMVIRFFSRYLATVCMRSVPTQFEGESLDKGRENE